MTLILSLKVAEDEGSGSTTLSWTTVEDKIIYICFLHRPIDEIFPRLESLELKAEKQ